MHPPTFGAPRRQAAVSMPLRPPSCRFNSLSSTLHSFSPFFSFSIQRREKPLGVRGAGDFRLRHGQSQVRGSRPGPRARPGGEREAAAPEPGRPKPAKARLLRWRRRQQKLGMEGCSLGRAMVPFLSSGALFPFPACFVSLNFNAPVPLNRRKTRFMTVESMQKLYSTC